MLAAETLPNLPELTIDQAEAWIAAALAEARALRQHDAQIYPVSQDPEQMRIAEELHAAWRRWAEQAGVLYDRVRPVLENRQHVIGADDLSYCLARARAMLSITPAQMLAREEQVRRGEVKTLEEVRRELRSAPRG
jgi:hypothetical protein